MRVISVGVELGSRSDTGSVTTPPNTLPWIDTRLFSMVVRAPASPPR